jgi:hypothetical protein
MKPSSFLFHVPGASNVFDKDTHEFLYDNNWLNLEQLKSLEQKPDYVEVIQRCGVSSRKMGYIETAIALIKFSD